MSGSFQQIVLNQFEAALGMLNLAIERCPDAAWNEPVANLAFCQAAFHTLFFGDYYLERSSDTTRLKAQSFHREHAAEFRDYEELEDRPQALRYERGFIRAYLRHVLSKARDVIAAETDETLWGPSGFEWLPFPRVEAHLYSLRHIQHHAAQLIVRLRQQFDPDVPWVRSGWREA